MKENGEKISAHDGEFKVKLIHREIRENFDEPLHFLEEYERWKTDIGTFDYYSFHAPENKFYLQFVSWFIHAGGPFSCSGPPLWVSDINPIVLIALVERPARRIYNFNLPETSLLGGELPAFFEMYNAEPNSVFQRMYERDQKNNRHNPQATLERLIKVHKPDQWSWEKITDLIYENITKARDVILGYARQIPNENIARVIGDLELKKPEPQSFENNASS